MLFPWRGMFEQIALADVYVHYDDVEFSKGSFTNRVQIKTSTGSSWLTVPLTRGSGSRLIRDLTANDEIDWREKHLRQLAEAYRRAEHRDDVLGIVKGVYADRAKPLVDVLIDSMEAVGERLGVLAETEVHRSSTLDVPGSSTDRVLAVVRRFGGDVYVTGHGARRYLDFERFEAAGVEVRFIDYDLRPYPQLHGDFDPYVTALDLLANCGSGAAAHLHPRTVNWRDFLARG